jgi:hypothetical protein
VEKPDDYETVPMEIQKKILEFIENTLYPAILEFLKEKYDRILAIPVRLVPFERLCFCWDSLEKSLSREQQYDIFKMRCFGGWPTTHCFKVSARDIVGAAIRVCRHIGKLELEDKLRGYIGDCFIPDEESVRPDPYKKHFLDYKGSSVCDDADAANLQGD